MKIQLALDRMEISEAIELTRKVEDSVDWIEVGTSLIKEFGMASVGEMKQAFPAKTIVADIKTIDNARYEFEMCFEAGADVATVMGVSPLVTIEACMEVAGRYNKTVMIDLLNTTEHQKRDLMKYKNAVFCEHVSKDQQEELGASNHGVVDKNLYGPDMTIAAAGGITLDSLDSLRKTLNPSIVIIGSAITKAENPAEAAAKFKCVEAK
ncbi:3-hexulose-6-phosphate synthase [Neobacillus sp. 179-C4.2 HS]|uniref:3-hexulose-6-phosphate synthase n=1 Tax=Neobacillus driksii TaxID=3035913 RepID=A0ABV4Z2G0_9BACI|nr:3-hexulose-6-phosphate synthase [Neobacillus sp. 179.-C4.2 HS]MDP5196844.1 orotidine 5'-phosphate decarboxylase [Neobacillus sp. 179.-C4.2 HS]